MSRLLLASVLAIGLSSEAFASSHREAPYRGTNGRAVAESSTIYDQLAAIYQALMGETPTPAVQPAAPVQVRRPGYAPTR